MEKGEGVGGGDLKRETKLGFLKAANILRDDQ